MGIKRTDYILFPLLLFTVFYLHHFPTLSEAMPILFNFYIASIYFSLVFVVRNSIYFTMFVLGCSIIHGILGYWNLTAEASEIHKWHLMLLADSLQIYGGSRYFIHAYKQRVSYLRVQMRESNEH